MKVKMAKYNGLLIDGEWYIVENIFSKEAKETVEDKLRRLILANAPTKNNAQSSQKSNN